MTYAEVKNRLSQVETALQSLQSKNAPSLDTSYVSDSISSLQTIQETLTKQLKVLEEGSEETMFISTKGGDTKAVKMDRKTAMDLKKDPAITGIDTAKGASLKEQEGVRFSVEDTKAIAKRVGKALVKAIVSAGDQIARIKAHRIEEDSFDIHVIYKGESGEDEFSFYIKDDTLHLADFTFTKKLVKVGVKPSGDAIVNVDVLANELLKHFRSLSEEVNDGDEKLQEAPHQTTYIKVAIADYRKTMSILDNNIDPTYVKMDVVDDDGDGNVIIYFNFKHEAGFDDMYDDSENKDSEFYQEPEEDPAAFIYDVAMDLKANDIPVRGSSHDIDEAADNSDWAMKVRGINKHGRDMRQVDRLKKSTPSINPNYKKNTGLSPKKKAIIDKLEAKRAQVMRDMEQEAEPQGGPISDLYGDMLNKIDTALEKARGGKTVHYDDRHVDTSTNENAIDPAEYGDIGKSYLAGFKKQNTLNLDQLEQLGRKIVKQLYKGDFAAAKAKHLSETGSPDDSLFTFGFDLDEIQYVVDYLKANYSEQDYELHVGRGDTHPNAVTLINPEMEKDAKLGDLLDGAKGSDQTDYEDYRREEDDYANNELPEETKKLNESASQDLDEIFGALGYRQGFDEFIEDNPGCVEVIMEWIGSISEFRDTLSNEFSKEEQEQLGFYYGDDDEEEYNESTVKEGRGDLDTIVRVITDMAAEDGTTTKEAALEVIEALRDAYMIDAYDESVEEGDGLWANINAKKKRGEKASHGNSKAFKAAKKAGKALAKTKESVLKEFTDNSFKGSEIIDMVNKAAPDMFGKQLFADLFPKGIASENDAIEALKAHDKSPIKARMGRYAPMFVHVQYHNIEHEGEEYQVHQTQYYNSNFKDKDPNFSPRVTRITIFKDPEGEDTNLGMILVKTGEYVQDLNNLVGGSKKHMEEVNEATRQDLGMVSSISKRRAKAHLKNPSNDGSKIYGLDKDGKRVRIKSINDVDKFTKFEIDADLNENKVADKDIEKEIKLLQKENPKGYAAEIKKLKVRLAAINLSKKKVIKEEATCCGKCGREHVKDNCKRPYLKGAKHCRTK